MRRVLFISYAYPPTGGGGVQRSVKFTKYLSQFGWQPTVLTVTNPSVPVRDNDLLADVDPAMKIVQAPTWEPGYHWKQRFAKRFNPFSAAFNPAVSDAAQPRSSRPIASLKPIVSFKTWVRGQAMGWLQPDPQVLWNRPAFRCASHALQRQQHDAIFVTGPPFSSFLLACRLKRAFSLPLIIDFRDEWMLACRYLDNHQQTGPAAKRQHAMMQDVLATADAVIATTNASAEELKRCCAEAGSRADVNCIHNGYDPSDLPISARDTIAKETSSMRHLDFGVVNLVKDPEAVGSFTRSTTVYPIAESKRNASATQTRFRLVYTGTLWRLTNIGPLIDAITRLHDSNPDLLSRLELTLAGRRTALQNEILHRLDVTAVTLVRHDYLPHDESLQLAADADALLLLLSNDEGAERVVPAKLFEYLALQRPVLAICPNGETSDLLQKHGKTQAIIPDDTTGIADWLTKRLQGEAGLETSEPNAGLLQFSRPALTKRLADLLTGCVDSDSATRNRKVV